MNNEEEKVNIYETPRAQVIKAINTSESNEQISIDLTKQEEEDDENVSSSFSMEGELTGKMA